jgi:hypothetical protein
MDKRINLGMDYIRDNIDNFFNVTALKEDKEDQLKSFVELLFFYNLIPEDAKSKFDLYFIRDYALEIIDKHNMEMFFGESSNAFAGLSIIEKFLNNEGLTKYKQHIDKLAQKTFKDRVIQVEKTVFRLLDIKYSLDVIGIKTNLPSYQEFYEQTVLGKDLPLVYSTIDSMYSITHTIFYLTDMGNDYLLDEDIPDISFILRSLIGNRIIEKDLDILGELLIGAFLLDISGNFEALMNKGIETILNSQKQNGSFPAPNEYEYSSSYEEFRNNYHTTCVCLGVLLWCQEIKS